MVAVAVPSGGSGSMNWLLGLSSDTAQIPQRSSCPVFGRSGVRLPGHWEQCGRKLRVNSRNSDVFKLVLWESLFSGPIHKLKQKKLRMGLPSK